MRHNLPLSTVIEVALQHVKTQKQLDYVMKLSKQIDLLEQCYTLESASK